MINGKLERARLTEVDRCPISASEQIYTNKEEITEDYTKLIKEVKPEQYLKSCDLPDARMQLVHKNDDANDDVYITINLKGMKRPVKVRVNSGADVLLLKIENISELDWINKLSIRTIGGAFNGSSKTLGVFNTSWVINNNSIETSWQVIDNRNYIPADGIVGRNMLWKNSIIDARSKTVRM